MGVDLLQSPVNDGYYDENDLLHLSWEWPKETWFRPGWIMFVNASQYLAEGLLVVSHDWRFVRKAPRIYTKTISFYTAD